MTFTGSFHLSYSVILTIKKKKSLCQRAFLPTPFLCKPFIALFLALTKIKKKNVSQKILLSQGMSSSKAKQLPTAHANN